MAISYWKTNNIDLALQNILKALEINPDNHNANVLYAELEISNHNYSHAMELLKKCEKDYETKGFHLQRLYKRRKRKEGGAYGSTFAQIMEPPTQ